MLAELCQGVFVLRAGAGTARELALQRAILDHDLAGNHMSKGLGFIPADEVGEAHRYYLEDNSSSG
jgi:hypothetical protein